jgi:hypothetical protein
LAFSDQLSVLLSVPVRVSPSALFQRKYRVAPWWSGEGKTYTSGS